MRETFELIFAALTIGAFFYLRQIFLYIKNNMLPNYFNEKGKNLASKEDVEELTEKVEAVRVKFIHETEALKSKLNVIQSLQNNLLAEERNAIVDLNSKFAKWYNLLTDSLLGGVDTNDNNALESQLNKMWEVYYDFLYSETKFTLFVDDYLLLNLSSKIKGDILNQLAPLYVNYVHKLKSSNSEVVGVKGRPKDEIDAVFERRNRYREDHIDALIKAIKILTVEFRDFQIACRKYLYDLLSK